MKIFGWQDNMKFRSCMTLELLKQKGYSL